MLASRSSLWIDRSLRFAMGSSATIASALLGIVRNKWIATQLHAAGLGVLAQTSSAQMWLGALGGMGLGLPVGRAVGAARGSGDEASARRTVWTALSLVGLGTTAVAAVGLIFASPISVALLGTPRHGPLVRIAAVGAAGIALQGLLYGFFAGRSDLKANLTLALSGGVTALLVTVALVPAWGLAGAAIGVATLAPAGILGVILFHRRAYAGALVPMPRPPLDWSLARSLLAVGAAAVTLSLVELGVMVTVRAHYLGANGVAANGLLQAALALAQQVGTLFYAYLSNYAFGKISAANGVDGIRTYTRRHWCPLVALATIAFAGAMVASTPLLHILYSSRFDTARPLMAWALWGEFCRVGMNIWSVGALPLAGPRLWLPIAMAPSAGLALCYAALSPSPLGPMTLPFAYAGAGFFALCFGGITMSRAGVTLTGRDVALIGVAALALASLARWVAG